eukprot:11820370-Karenia_brevis.AAC.1
MKEYIKKVHVVEDNAVDQIRDLQEDIGRTVKDMIKEMQREKRSSMAVMTHLLATFNREMQDVEAKILRHSRAVAQRSAPVSSPARQQDAPASGA